jgi:hypothetical protein
VSKGKLQAQGVVPDSSGSDVFIDLPRYVLDREAEAEMRRIARDVLDRR